MNIEEKIKTRAMIYDIISDALAQRGFQTEPIAEGRLVHLDGVEFGKVKFSIFDNKKFNLDKVRADYIIKNSKKGK